MSMPHLNPPSTAPKHWFKTSYFWVLVLVNVGTIVAAAVDLFPPTWVPFVNAISAGCFAIARGLVGMGKAIATGAPAPPVEVVVHPPPPVMPEPPGGHTLIP